MTSLHLRERMKGVGLIAIVVTIGCYTYPPILTAIIVAVCADEYFNIITLLARAIQPPLSSSSSPSSSSSSSSSSPLPASPPLYRFTFIFACLTMVCGALVSHQMMTTLACAWTFVYMAYGMFRQIETPRHHVKVEHKKPKSATETPTSGTAMPAQSLYLASTPLESAQQVLILLLPVVGLWYAGFLFSHTILILNHPSTSSLSDLSLGLRRIMYTIFTTAGGENGGMLIGRLTGRVKLTPKISPNKSREGAIAQVIVSAIVSVVFAHCIEIEFTLIESLLLGLMLGYCGMIGDLFESFLKRSVGIKDAGSIIPGAGGMLDRMDGLIFNFPLLYYWVEYGHGRM